MEVSNIGSSGVEVSSESSNGGIKKSNLFSKSGIGSFEFLTSGSHVIDRDGKVVNFNSSSVKFSSKTLNGLVKCSNLFLEVGISIL